MSKLTKVELVQINSKLAADNAALRAQLGAAQADIELINDHLMDAEQLEMHAAATCMELRKQVADLTRELEIARARSTACAAPTHRVARHMPAWQAERAAAMAAARDMAMRMGCVTKVQA